MKPKILIIEDEGGIVDNISYTLKSDGFDIHWAQTGAEGLDVISSSDISLIILDIGLPDINGFELFKEIRKKSSTPIIFLTARGEEIDRVVGLEMGADDYVTKPFSPRELAARVKAVLRRATTKNQTAEICLSKNFPFEVDDQKKIIRYQNRNLVISRYEYRILKVLIEHPGWVFSREQLMEKAWDEPDVSLVRTVDTHIKNIRSKLKDITPGCDPIVTHRGIGYSLNEDW